ncbi:MAG: peptidyl-prolyl cis-trans isomerase [Candidatus Omnitrophica bacterium]|nr:peptidyl-prolyl cis-trans isomerase [Candidatus Omnitrophota bacterium]
MIRLKRNRIEGLLFVTLFCFLAFAVPAGARDLPSDGIIAIVNDDVITLKDLRQYVASIYSQLKIENKSPEEIKEIMGDYEQKGLDKLIEDKLILAAANEKEMIIREEVVDRRIKEIKDRYASEDEFLQAISVEGLSVSDLRKKLIDQLKVKYIVDFQVRDKIFVNPQNVTEYYNKHMNEFERKTRMNLQSVFVSFEKHNKQEAHNRADEARARMIAGEDFSKIFKEYSDAASVGEIEQGQMVDAIENVVFNLKLEEVSLPVEVENGIYVFKAIGILPGKLQTLKEVKDQIYNKLFDAQFQSKFKEWVDLLRKKAYVEIK